MSLGIASDSRMALLNSLHLHHIAAPPPGYVDPRSRHGTCFGQGGGGGGGLGHVLGNRTMRNTYIAQRVLYNFHGKPCLSRDHTATRSKLWKKQPFSSLPLPRANPGMTQLDQELHRGKEA